MKTIKAYGVSVFTHLGEQIKVKISICKRVATSRYSWWL